LTAASVILELNNVEVRFGSEVILKDVNIKIAKGERVSIIGPSGQGKSVLLKTMGGLIKPSQGSVCIESEDWTKLKGPKLRSILSKVGMLFQKNALFDSLTCGENIAFPLREVTDQDEAKIQTTVIDFLEAVGISHALKLYPDEISGGMQKRLGIARALALEPHIIFYDDPTAGLDPITSKKIIELICVWQKQLGSTVVAITNDMNRAYQMSERILMVVDHQVLEAGTPKSILRNQDPRVRQFIRGELKGPLTVMN
jgi:phospholipid/cholesterol/gamma-HCH transport system ATP-binding protein